MTVLAVCRRAAAAFSITLVAGCADEITLAEAGARLERVSGDGQVTLPGGRVPRPLVVRALDEQGNPRQGVVVRWSGSGNSSFAAASDTTGPDGRAIGIWIVGDDATYTATAHADDVGETTFESETDPDALTISAMPDTVRLHALADTATVFIRIRTTDGSLDTLVAPNGWGATAPIIARPVFTGPRRMTLQAEANGVATQQIRFGQRYWSNITVIVQQVPVGLRILSAPATDPARDTIVIGPDSTVALAVYPVDSRGYAVEGSESVTGVTWTSANDEVATMDDGTAHAVADGITQVSAHTSGDVVQALLRVWTMDLTALEAGGATTCGLGIAGQLICWGFRDVGGSSALEHDPAPVERFAGPFTAVSMSEYTGCALTSAGVARCWGVNSHGQLGIGRVSAPEHAPVTVPGALTFASISAGEARTCGLTTGGEIYCWGFGYAGGLGDGTNGEPDCDGGCRPVPARVAGDRKYVQLTVGGGQACAVATDARGYCWGHNLYGALGSPRERCIAYPGEDTTKSFPVYCSAVPVEISGDMRFTMLSSGIGATCGITTDGRLYCWGSNLGGILGTHEASLAFQAAHPAPLAVAHDRRFTQVAVGRQHACAIDESGAAWCWGQGFIGQLGIGAIPTESCQNGPCAREPAAVAGGLTFTSLTLGTSHTCGFTADDRAYCWGWGESGALGTGASDSRMSPARVVFQRPQGSLP